MRRKKLFWAVYILCAAISWFPITGWVFASEYNTERFWLHSGPAAMEEHTKHDAEFVSLWGLVAVSIWPITLPGAYLYSGFAEYGWRPVWHFKSEYSH